MLYVTFSDYDLQILGSETDDSDFEEVPHPRNVSTKNSLLEDIDVLNFAPGETGKFVNPDIVKYAEEQCFPHLFPQGIFV